MSDEKESIVCIYTGDDVTGVHLSENLVVEINGERIPYINQIVIGENGVLGAGDFCMATITLAVRLGKP